MVKYRWIEVHSLINTSDKHGEPPCWLSEIKQIYNNSYSYLHSGHVPECSDKREDENTSLVKYEKQKYQFIVKY